jgi:hypothetical protein
MNHQWVATTFIHTGICPSDISTAAEIAEAHGIDPADMAFKYIEIGVTGHIDAIDTSDNNTPFARYNCNSGDWTDLLA